MFDYGFFVEYFKIDKYFSHIKTFPLANFICLAAGYWIWLNPTTKKLSENKVYQFC